MDKKTFLKLLDNYLNGTATATERELVEEYYKRLDAKGQTLLTPEQEQAIQQFMLKNIQQQIKQPIPLIPLSGRNAKFSFRIFAAAASLFIVLMAGLYFGMHRNPATETSIGKSKPEPNDIAPGGNHAMLTLADGTTIILDNAKNGELVTEGSTAVNKTKDGQLVYDASDPQPSEGVFSDTSPNVPKKSFRTQLIYHTITTPQGGQYQVILPDGTKVWLNAASSLRFPTNFTGKERNVELTGEAYFEVAKISSPLGGSQKGAMPFKVVVNAIEVKVLGTHFNIMAYNDESGIKTTLLKGSVKVKNSFSEAVLKPGQQAQLDKGNQYISVSAGDTEAAVAWKNGYFMFKNENIQSIMRKIARWYDVEIEYRGNVTRKTFGGTISRFENVSEVLKIMELTGTIHFKIEGSPAGKDGGHSRAGRRIIVML